VLANRQQMVQLFQDLISNAIKYRSDKMPEIQISATVSNTGDEVLTVCDNGAGFDMRYAEEVFRIFRRLHAADEHT
jgi:two-component system, chemotaxis family, sensor kinase Cph1